MCHGAAAPAYLQELCVPVEDSEGAHDYGLHLRYSTYSVTEAEDVNGTTRSFAFHGPSVWNSLPSTLKCVSESVQRATKDVFLWSWTTSLNFPDKHQGLKFNNKHVFASTPRLKILSFKATAKPSRHWGQLPPVPTPQLVQLDRLTAILG